MRQPYRGSGRIAVGQRAHVNALFLGGLDHFQAVFVGSGQEKDITALQPHEAGNSIGGNHFIGMADMWHTIGIGYGGGE